MALRSEINADVPVAAPGEFAPLPLTDDVRLWPPVVLAPMAGVTNPPYRRLCRRMGAGLYVAEMVHSRGLSERNARTVGMASFADDEPVRSIQIFGADPADMADAARFLVQEVGVDHIDVNMGCPVRKVTGRGSGSALPARPKLMLEVLSAVVRAAGAVPVTTKIRLGLDDRRHTWADALAATTDSGCRWMGVHARTAQAGYSGQAQWDWIGRIVERAQIPILGNGDIWEAFDALRMMRATGCQGVIIGRGCLGRPWLFRELAQVFDGVEPDDPPALGDVLALAIEHAQLLVDHFGERKGMLEMRKWCSWYTKGFPGSAVVREGLQKIDTLADMESWLGQLDPEIPFPARALRVPRAKRGSSQEKVHLPHGWLDGEGDDGACGADACEADATDDAAAAAARPPGADSPAVPWSGG